jgi:hypothetical protein
VRLFFCESETSHFHFHYDQINYSRSALGDLSVAFQGDAIGFCYQDGRTEIINENAHVLVGNAPGTPLDIQKVAVCLEYLYSILGQGPCSLECVKNRKVIDVTVGRGKWAAISADGHPKVGIDIPAADENIPALCLRALLALEFVQTNNWPAWVLPPFASRVAVVQVPDLIVPNAYAWFGQCSSCEQTLAYDAEWNPVAGSRSLQIHANKPLRPNMPAAVFVKFDDATMRDDSIKLSLTGRTPDGNTINIPVTMAPSHDHVYYYGFFSPVNTWSRNYGLQLKIVGTRSFQKNDILSGLLPGQIDGNPGTLATPDPSSGLALVFSNYEPGADKAHHIEIGNPALYAPIVLLPPDKLEGTAGNNSFSRLRKSHPGGNAAASNGADPQELEWSSGMRRLLESVGLQRQSREVNPLYYSRQIDDVDDADDEHEP